jgi:hypothetical protein
MTYDEDLTHLHFSTDDQSDHPARAFFWGGDEKMSPTSAVRGHLRHQLFRSTRLPPADVPRTSIYTQGPATHAICQMATIRGSRPPPAPNIEFAHDGVIN